MKLIEAGKVLRWFTIDWEFFGGVSRVTEIHDAAFDALGELKNVAEVNSGHTGINVSFEDDKRSDEVLIRAIQRQLRTLKQERPTQ